MNNNSTFEASNGNLKMDDESLHPHFKPEQPQKAVFGFYGHKIDTLKKAVTRMRPPSEPKINKDNPKVWFIYWNHDVPVELWPKYNRKRIRIKVYDDINSYSGEMTRDEYADFRADVYNYLLFENRYSPFDEELARFRELQNVKTILTEKIETIEEMTEEEIRQSTPIDKALNLYIKSRISRKLAKASISGYQSSIDWIVQGLTFCGYGTLPIGKLKHTHLSEALDYIAEEREWSATTINKEVERLIGIFNWLEIEDYVIKNPSRGKFIKLPTQKSKHRWYEPEIKDQVKKAIKAAGKITVYRAMQFTYFTLIRSKIELRKLRIGDIDRTLKRIRFTADMSKNNKEQYRDYPSEFDQVLDDMKLKGLPQEWFVFGKGDGKPGPYMCSHNFFSKQFKVIKDRIGLSPDYTIYGMKHTRIVHELMKGTEGKDITHMARHSDFRTTTDYLRDYDLTLKHIYKPEDLTF